MRLRPEGVLISAAEGKHLPADEDGLGVEMVGACETDGLGVEMVGACETAAQERL